MQSNRSFRASRLAGAIRRATGAALVAGLTGTSALAAEIEEVIVTATRQAESVQDVPIAVAAFSGQMLEDKQIINPSDLQMNAPSVSFTATNFGGSSFSIRGIGRLVIGGSGESGVSTHINEIPLNTNLNAVEFYDMERVEVLRGPQGTLFGRNATGGAINFITRRPDFDEVGGFIDAEYGDYNHTRLKGALNLPVTENFALRIAGMWLQRDGYIDNVAFNQVGTDGSTLSGIDDDVDGRDIQSFRITGEWNVTDRLNVWAMAYRFEEDDDRARITNQVCVKNDLPTTGCLPDAFGFESPHLGSTTGGIFGGSVGALPLGADGTQSDPTAPDYVQYVFPRPENLDFRDMHTDYEPIFQDEETTFAFGAKYEFDSFDIQLLGAYQEREFFSRQDYLMDVGATLQPTALNPTGLWPTSEPAGRAGDDFRGGPCDVPTGTGGIFGGCVLDVDQTRVFAFDQADSESQFWTIEAKIATSFDGPFNVTAGVSAYDGESYGDYYVNANTLDLVGQYPNLFGPPLYPTMFNNVTDPAGGNLSDGWAVFGEAYYDVTDTIKLTLGLRYNEDNKDISDTSILFNAVDLNTILGGALGPDPVFVRGLSYALQAIGAAPAPSAGDQALAAYHGVDAAAASAAAAFDLPGVLTALAGIPLTPAFGETRDLTGSPRSAEWTEVSGRVGIDWAFSDNGMVYAFYSRGYKPGGFNPAIPPEFQASSKFTFDEETVDAFEVGTKNTLLDGRLTANASWFFYDYGGLQTTRIANNTSLNDNIDAEIWGIELETFWRPEFLEGLAVDFSYSYLKTEVKGSQSIDPVNRTAGNPEWILLNNFDPGSTTAVNFIARESQLTPALIAAAEVSGGTINENNTPSAVGSSYANGIPAYWSRSFLEASGVDTSDGLTTDLDGKALPNTPENSFHIGAAYTWEVSRISGNLTARWDYYWQDDSFAREFNTRGDAIDSWDQHNASLIYESFDGHWTAKAWVRNIQDENNVTGKYLTADTSGFFRNYFLTEPRIWGASVRYGFGGN